MVKRLHHGLLALVLATCLPPPLDESGKRCSGERPCGEAFVCLGGRCFLEGVDAGPGPDDAGPDGGRDAGADAGPDGGFDGGGDGGLDAGPEVPDDVNLLLNPGFELMLSDAGVRAWRSTNGTMTPLSPGRTGSRAVRLTGQPTSGPSITSEFIAGPTAFPMFFCARAFGRNEFDAGYSFTVTIRERLVDGGTNSSSGGSSALSRDAGWVAATEEYGAIGGRGVELRISSDVRADASVLVDDAELFWTTTGRCVFP
jgi:hypothetical protein